MIPCSIWLGLGSYLMNPEGKWTMVHGLDRIFRDIAAAGIRVYWGTPPGDKIACAYWWRNEIVLAPRIVRCDPCDIKYALSHEAGHCAARTPSDDSACLWQWSKYAELLTPAWAA